MVCDRGGGGLPHLRIAFDEAAVGRFIEQKRQPVPHILADAVAQRGDRLRDARCVSEPSSAASARAVAISFLTPEFVSTPRRCAQQRHGLLVQRARHLPHRVQAHRRIRARQARSAPRWSAERCRKPLFVPILVEAIRGGGSGILQGQRIDQIEGIRIGRLDDKNLLIAVAVIEPVFQQRREDRADAADDRSGSAVRQYSPCRSTSPRAARRASTGKLASFAEIGRVPGASAPKGEQQHEQPLPARREVFHYL